MKPFLLFAALFFLTYTASTFAQARKAPTSARPTASRPAAKGAKINTVKGKPSAKPAASGGAANVAGTWISEQWGEMKLTQTGNKVRGTYNYQQGRVEGTVRGNTVDLKWWEPANPQKDDYDMTIHPERGNARFMVDNRQGAMNGTWKYERQLPAERPDGDWQLRKVVTASSPATAKAATVKAGAKTATRPNAKGGAARPASRPAGANRATARR
jgi:hypothetical protein